VPNKNQANFENALKKVLQVSKRDLNRLLEEEHKANTGKPKPGPKSSSSAPASRAKQT